MSIERWLALTALAGFIMAVMGFAQWMAQQGAHRVAVAAPHVATIELPMVFITAQRDHADEVASYYAQLRARIHWVPTRVGREVLSAPDYASRMLLAKAAARYAHLDEVGLGYRDVYGIINAETSWAPRAGASRDGTPNLGIAQFEPETARALGVRDPDDVVEAVHAVAMHMKEAAQWSNARLRGLKLGRRERAEKLREGVSIYYNLSTRGRNLWNGMNTAQLPVQTQRHIANAKFGAQEAAMLDAQLRADDQPRMSAILSFHQDGGGSSLSPAPAFSRM
jgi:hypothetical protein